MFFFQKTRLRNKGKIDVVNLEIQREHPRNILLRDINAPRVIEEYITQVSEDIEGRVTKKMSRKLSRTRNRILRTLSKVDEFLLNSQVVFQFGIAPGTSQNTEGVSQDPNEDRSQIDPHPEVGTSVNRFLHTLSSEPDTVLHSI